MVDMRRNVGTPGAPESYLHARTVALLYDEMTRPGTKDTGVWIRTNPGGAYDVDIRAGVARTKIPGEWDSVGGIVPDLIMYGDDDTPVRIVEVVVTSPPTAQKRACLDRLVKRGVDVVEVRVRTEEDLLLLCRRVDNISFRVSDKRDGGVGVSSQYYKARAREYDRQVETLLQALINCSPDMRKAWVEIMKRLETMESLYPLRPDNPLAERLQERP